MTQSLTKFHPDSPNGHDAVARSESTSPDFAHVLQARLSRRQLFKGGFGLAASGLFGGALAGCGSSGATPMVNAATPTFQLGFTAVAKTLNDVVTLPTGYSYNVLVRTGDPLNLATPDYANDGSDTASSFEMRAGDHHDGMAYFGLNAAGTGPDGNSSTRGLLAMNHENITQVFLHSAAEAAAGFSTASRVRSQIDKEVNAHGVVVVEMIKNGTFGVNKLSGFNRRITAATPIDLNGPAAGDDLMVTAYSNAGTATRGTLNNCAHGVTPWGTYLTCEENWAGYFRRPASAATATTKAQAAQNRYMGASASNGSYGWANPTGGDPTADGLYARWDITPGAAATSDYRNAANTFGWVVEVDPYNPAARPRKRTALGRFGHEGAMPARVAAGKPIVYYMGDDAKGEYIYKYVSTANWDAADANGGLAAGNKYLDAGKLYVATFNADGTGVWKELSVANATLAAGVTSSGFTYTFADQADVLVHTRIAADGLGATPMDRPEWADVHPVTGDVYITLTKNDDRGKTGTTNGGKSRALDAANPRYYDDGEGNKGNPNGHIIRMREDNNSDPAALTFKWDIYLFGAETGLDTTSINVSALTDDNDFSSPDGLWFSRAVQGLMWIQTDDSSYTDVTNCMMLAALPGAYNDGTTRTLNNLAVPANGNAAQSVQTYVGAAATVATLKRFLVGPRGCEITGIAETPDGKTIFVNIQHPGEDTRAADIGIPANYQSHWPEGGTARPRSATIAISKNDGGLVGS